MEVTTIVGIVFTICFILYGLRIFFKKPEDDSLSLDNALHVDPDSQQPIIPRHARDQLVSADNTPLADATHTELVEEPPVKKRPTNSLVELQQAILEQEQEAQQQEAQQQKVNAQVQSNTAASAETIKSKHIHTEVPVSQALATEQRVEQDTTKPQVEKVATENMPVEDAKPEVAPVTAEIKAPELLINKDLDVSPIEEFDGESNILDLHLTEQQRFDDESALANAENIIALNVYPNIRFALSGDKTLKTLLKYGLRYGEMACFHRYEKIDEPSQLMFSVLRITDEGHAGFDLETLSTEQVHGLAFFLALPHNDVQKGYDTMVSIAGLIARDIDGTVYDENNLEFTPQLKEHWRHQAIDYRSTQEA